MVAIPLPNGFTQFSDANGAPYEGGTVEHYEPGGLTPKDTWQDYNQTIFNYNPLTLDEAGRAVIFGNGRYRQILKDKLGNTIWDQETDALVFLAADVILTYGGGPPASGQWLGGERFARAVNFPANFVGSQGLIPKTLPTSAFTISINKNGSQVGTASCSTSGAWTFLTTGGNPVSFVTSDYLDFVGPGSADATIADFGVTLAGSYLP